MRPVPAIGSICFFAFLTIASWAFPLDLGHSELEPRRRPIGNQRSLKCGNAPTVVAGDLLNSSDVPTPQPNILPPSGSDQEWLSKLWCTPGTRTYTLFGIGRLTPPPLTYRNTHAALQDAIVDLQAIMKEKGDGPVLASVTDAMMGIAGVWYTQPGASHFRVYAQSHVGILTYGVLVASLTGLSQYIEAGYDLWYDTSRDPMVFQINDSDWGTVGIGYLGYIDPATHECMYQLQNGVASPCSDVYWGKVIH